MDNLENNGLGITVYAPCNYNAQYAGQEKYLIKAPCFNKTDRLFYHYKYNKICNNLISNMDLSEYEILHAHSLFANGYIAYKVFKKYKIPYIVAVRNTDINVFFKYFIYLRKIGLRILENASKIIFISNSYKEKLLNKYIPKSMIKCIEDKCIVIPNGIDNYFFNTEKKVKHIKNKKVNLVYTGRIDKNKNLITTIKCCNIFLKHKYDVSLNVIGQITSNRYKKILEKYKFINYLGEKSKEEIVDIYKNMDIFVMPSKHETFGLTYVEAMSQGLPIIYTKNEGFDKFFNDGTVGYPIKYNDYKEMNEKIEFIINKYDTLSKNCYEKSLDFNWKDISLKYIKIYEEIRERRMHMNKNNVIMLLDNCFKPDVRVYKEAKYLVSNGFNIEIICMDRKNEFLDKPEEVYDEIKIKRFYTRNEKITKIINKNHIVAKLKYFIYFIWLLKFIKQVKKYLKNKDFDVLHCHDLTMAFCGVIFLKNKKIVFDMHEYYSNKKSKFQNWIINKIVKFVQKKSTWIVHVNEFQIKDIKEREKLIFLPNYPQKHKFENLHYVNSKVLRISYTGYVRHYVPLSNLMKAANELNDVCVQINGEGIAYDILKEESKTLKNCILTGKYNHDDISKFYENSDILYCVYNQENKNDETAIPTKFYEALMSKTPLIVSKNTAMEEFIKKYDIGFVVDGTDYINIKEVIKKILENPTVLEEKRNNIQNRIFDSFTWENIAKNLDIIYKKDEYNEQKNK